MWQAGRQAHSRYLTSGMATFLVFSAVTVLPLPSVTFMLTVYFSPGARPGIGHAGLVQVTVTDLPEPNALAVYVNFFHGPPSLGGVPSISNVLAEVGIAEASSGELQGGMPQARSRGTALQAQLLP